MFYIIKKTFLFQFYAYRPYACDVDYGRNELYIYDNYKAALYLVENFNSSAIKDSIKISTQHYGISREYNKVSMWIYYLTHTLPTEMTEQQFVFKRPFTSCCGNTLTLPCFLQSEIYLTYDNRKPLPLMLLLCLLLLVASPFWNNQLTIK